MNRDEMIEGVMRHAGISKANVERFYDGLVELVRAELQRRKEFVLPGLGVLRVRQRLARMARNPRTGQAVKVPARRVVRFRGYSALDELLNGPREKAQPSSEPSGQLPIPPEQPAQEQ
jgi:DNA-binding protein HU-beta